MSVTLVRLGGGPQLPLLVLGPSLGTSVTPLWGDAARLLARDFQVVGFDLPGHGTNSRTYAGHDRADGAPPLTMESLAADVLEAVDVLLDVPPGARPPAFHYAGDSVGGAVGLQLLLDAPHRVASATLLATGAVLGTAASWGERIRTVLGSGTPALVEASASRWFAPGFVERRPEASSALLHALADADDVGYAAVCAALGGFDVVARLGEITAPVLAVAGAQDQATPPDLLRQIADGVLDGRLVVLDDVAHLPPVERPDEVARLVRDHALGPDPSEEPQEPHQHGTGFDAGLRVRREVLGDAHVDRATAATTDFTADFQRVITTYAWGEIWTRPGLDRRSRSMITLTALVAGGHHDELALHVRAARRNGLSPAEISEVLLQTAIYCGVPSANSAYRIAQQVLVELGDLPDPDSPGATAGATSEEDSHG